MIINCRLLISYVVNGQNALLRYLCLGGVLFWCWRVLVVCGIFGFVLRKPVVVDKVFRVLERLEVDQFPGEETAVGGFGAGVAVLEADGGVVWEKVGKVGDVSPVRRLSEVFDVGEASVLVAHVRRPSPEFMGTAGFRECAQPYVVERDPEVAVVSVHNGKVDNFVELRGLLGAGHVFESEGVGLIDSEVVAHVFEEFLSEKESEGEALNELFCKLHGNSTIALLQVGEENAFVHFVHNGKTRGLHVWTNERGELVFCSREKPLMEEFGGLISEGGFVRKVRIEWRENAGLVLSHPISMK
jgi:glutamine phosphoribosylpyrophosphate amidotransferase